MEISSAQIGSGEIGPPEIGVAEVDSFEVDFTEIKDGSSMCASPLVPGLGSLLEQFKVLLVCHLDHLLVDPIGIHLSKDHEFTPLKYAPGITSIVDSIDPDAIIARQCHSAITDDAGRHHKHLAIPQLAFDDYCVHFHPHSFRPMTGIRDLLVTQTPANERLV